MRSMTKLARIYIRPVPQQIMQRLRSCGRIVKRHVARERMKQNVEINNWQLFHDKTLQIQPRQDLPNFKTRNRGSPALTALFSAVKLSVDFKIVFGSRGASGFLDCLFNITTHRCRPQFEPQNTTPDFASHDFSNIVCHFVFRKFNLNPFLSRQVIVDTIASGQRS